MRGSRDLNPWTETKNSLIRICKKMLENDAIPIYRLITSYWVVDHQVAHGIEWTRIYEPCLYLHGCRCQD